MWQSPNIKPIPCLLFKYSIPRLAFLLVWELAAARPGTNHSRWILENKFQFDYLPSNLSLALIHGWDTCTRVQSWHVSSCHTFLRLCWHWDGDGGHLSDWRPLSFLQNIIFIPGHWRHLSPPTWLTRVVTWPRVIDKRGMAAADNLCPDLLTCSVSDCVS